ncbi:MAG: zf-HC2 domain-containing protein [Terriglobales bacterium]
MKCAGYKKLFSLYIDGQVSGAEMFALTRHMEACPDCTREYKELLRTQRLLAELRKAKVKAPGDMALRLRLAISRESKQARRARFDGAMGRLHDLLNAFMVPATAGVLSAVLTFGLLLGFFALPQQLQASSSDVPLMFYTGPELEQSAFGTSLGNMGSMGDESVVIEALVGANGRVEDYRILSHPDNAKAVMSQVKNLLIFTTFRPALSMGRPTAGRAVISFSKINVKG